MPNSVGRHRETSVHFTDFVSFFTVISVVAHGQCIKENSITDMAVVTVQPLEISSVRSSVSDSNSNILPDAIYAIMMMGNTISLAGKPKINAKSTMPSKPSSAANGSKKSAQTDKSVPPPTEILANSQMTIPAGAATLTARPSTNKVRSNTERTITLSTCGRR